MLTTRIRYWAIAIVGAGAMATLTVAAAEATSVEDFFIALRNDNVQAVNTMLGDGFDPNKRDRHGLVGLSVALQAESFAAAQALMAHPKLRIDALNASAETPLMIAALQGRLDWCKRLLDRGAKVNLRGWSPLHYAATGPEPKIVQLLLNRGAYIDARSPNRSTALMMAARYGAEANVRVLLDRGANAKYTNNQAKTAADFARLGGRTELAAQLDNLAH